MADRTGPFQGAYNSIFGQPVDVIQSDIAQEGAAARQQAGFGNAAAIASKEQREFAELWGRFTSLVNDPRDPGNVGSAINRFIQDPNFVGGASPGVFKSMMEVLQQVASNPQLQAELLRGGLRPTGQQTTGPAEQLGAAVQQDAFGHIEPGPNVVSRLPATTTVPGPTARALGMSPDEAAAMETVAGANPAQAAQQIGARLSAGPAGAGDPFTLSPGQARFSGSGRILADLPATADPTERRAWVSMNVDLLKKAGEEGPAAAARVGDINALEQALRAAESPYATLPMGVRSALAKWGINVEGQSALNTATAIGNRLAIHARAVGSGSTSNFEVDMLAQSLPNAWQTQAGRAMIAKQFRATAEYTRDRADISAQFNGNNLTETIAKLNLRDAEFTKLMKDLREAQMGKDITHPSGGTFRRTR